jgi:hypothetical protein
VNRLSIAEVQQSRSVKPCPQDRPYPLRLNAEGWLTTVTLAEVPGVLDTPPEIHAIVLEDPDHTHPAGAKGIGEPSLVGAAPTIANAIRGWREQKKAFKVFSVQRRPGTAVLKLLT